MAATSHAVLAALALLSSVMSASAEDESICAAPLNQALMTVRSNNQAGNQSAASTAWQCSFKFATHNQAIQSGLSVGTSVFGVPLKIGGTFDQQQVDQWKEDHCSKNDANSSFQAASLQYLREVAPGAMSAFAACIAKIENHSALSCTLTRDPGVFTLTWRRSDGEEQSTAPILSRFMVSNGKCNPGIQPNTVVSEGGIGSPCTALPKKDLVVLAETNRGICTAVAPYQKNVFSVVGTMKLQTDKKIVSDVVEFKDAGQIVIGDHALTIQADEIRLTGDGKIIAFEDPKGPTRPAGTSGRSAGSVLVRTKTVSGNDVGIDLTGEDGAPGATGDNGTQGSPGGKAEGRGLQGMRGCGGGHDATPGGQGTPGKDGGNGGNGGNGGVLVIEALASASQDFTSKLDIVSRDGNTIPGKGGAGGTAGIGGPGGPGGGGGGGHDGCGGRPGAPPGPKGPDGKPGIRGDDGKPGSIDIEGS